MRTANFDEAQTILATRGARRSKDNRPAFIAALIVHKTARMENLGSEGHRLKLMPPHLAEAFAAEFVRLATAIKAEAEAACNYERNAAQIGADERNQTRFKELAEALGFEARTGGDPRGACAFLIDPDDRKGDGWGEGWAVYR